MEIKLALSKEDFINCFSVVTVFRPGLNLDHYLNMILQMLDESYKLIFTEEENKAVAICGYRFITLLDGGKSIYIDSLYTLQSYRGKGHATSLLHHVLNEAKMQRVQRVHLVSGQLQTEAHQFYFKHGFKITSQQYSLELY
jgi:GNAT superfamily N-acetyltransferase